MTTDEGEDISLLAAELKKLRGRKGVLSPGKVGLQPDIIGLLGRGNAREAFEVLKSHLQRSSTSRSRTERAAALSIVMDAESAGDRLKLAGELMHAEPRTVRAWGDDGGFEAIAAEIIHTVGSGTAIGRQTVYLRYPDDEGALSVTFLAELPLGVDVGQPTIAVNGESVIADTDHIVRPVRGESFIEHQYALSIVGIPPGPDDHSIRDAAVLDILFVVPVDVRVIHRFVSNFRSQGFYVSSQTLGQSQMVHVVRK